jgi:hypothetical protein
LGDVVRPTSPRLLPTRTNQSLRTVLTACPRFFVDRNETRELFQGVNAVDVDLNTGLVSVKLGPGGSASMRQFNEAVEKNGFTHKDANIIAKGKISGTATAPFFEVAGTQDRFALKPAAVPGDFTARRHNDLS